eukprot:4189080-Heterocapsa_arctica.AAC.1
MCSQYVPLLIISRKVLHQVEKEFRSTFSRQCMPASVTVASQSPFTIAFSPPFVLPQAGETAGDAREVPQ